MLTPEQKKAKREAFFKKEHEEFEKKVAQHIPQNLPQNQVPSWKIEASEPDQTQFEGLMNVHTHGLKKMGLKDLQIVAPIHPQIAVNIIASVAQQMNVTHKLYNDGDIVTGIIENINLKVVQMKNEGEEVLRIIIPDESGNLEYKDQIYPFNKQYMDLE